MTGKAFVLQGTLNEFTIHDLADSLFAEQPFRDVDQALSFNLRALTFAEPYGIVVLATVLEKLAADGHTVEVVGPANPNCEWYLSSCGFFQHVNTFASVQAPEWTLSAPAASSSTVLPVQLLRREEDVAKVDSRVEIFLGLATRWQQRQPILSTIRELCVNVFHHARYPCGWIAGQRYWNRYQSCDFVEIAISDAGQGIRRSLGTRFPDILAEADGAAIQRMLVEGLSSSAGESRGNGYHILQEAAQQLDGSFSLRSGTGAVLRARGGILHRKDQLAEWPGTQLKVRFTLPK